MSLSVTEYQENNAALSFASHWSSTADTHFSGGAYQSTTTNGDTCTFTFTGRAVYLLTSTFHHTSGPVTFTYTIDGTAYSTVNLYNDSTQVDTQNYRVLVPLGRNLVDGSHTLVLTNTSGTGVGTLIVDSFIVVTGALGVCTPGLYVALGDSWTRGSGSMDNISFVDHLATMLQSRLGRSIVLRRKGCGGDKYSGGDATAHGDDVQTGGMYRTFSSLLSAAAQASNGGLPEFITYQFGENDLRSSALQTLDASGGNCGPGTFARHLHALLCLLEDTLPVSGGAPGPRCKVVVGTPGFVSPFYTIQDVPLLSFGSPPSTFCQGVDSYELGVQACRDVVTSFPWCSLAEVYETMEGRTSLVYTNAATSDAGLHPNDAGHVLLATEYLRAFLGATG